MNTFGYYENFIPLVSPVDTTTSAVATPYVDLKTVHKIHFLVFTGSIAVTSTDQPGPTITVECSTAASSNATEELIGFSYRMSGAVGADSWGAVTAGTTAGVALASSDDDTLILVEVDPAVVAAKMADARFVRLVFTPDAGASATEVAILAGVTARYRGAAPVSTT